MLREIPKPYVAVPTVTKAQMQMANSLMQSEYHVEPIQMFELASRHLAHLARLLFMKGRAEGKPVLVLVGMGWKACTALHAAKKLHQWGAKVKLVLAAPFDQYQGIVAKYLASAQRQGIIIFESLPQSGFLLIDGLLGSGLEGQPEGRFAELIFWANRSLNPVLSLDLPSGLDADTGGHNEACIRASATLSLGLPKAGLFKEQARPQAGEIYLGDIGIPPSLYASPGIGLSLGNIFSESDLVKLR